MENELRERVYFIINPNAAQGRSGEKWKRLCSRFEKQGLKFDVEKTTGKDSASAQVQEALHKGYRRIVAVGGDGLANEVLNGFIDPNTDRPYYGDAEFLFCLCSGKSSAAVRTLRNRIGRTQGFPHPY